MKHMDEKTSQTFFAVGANYNTYRTYKTVEEGLDIKPINQHTNRSVKENKKRKSPEPQRVKSKLITEGKWISVKLINGEIVKELAKPGTNTNQLLIISTPSTDKTL